MDGRFPPPADACGVVLTRSSPPPDDAGGVVLTRRRFLQAAGVVAATLGAAPLVAACAAGDGTGSARQATGRSSPAGIPSGQPDLSVVTASYETLTGSNRRLAFGLRTIDNEPVAGADLDVYLRDPDGAVLAGPLAAEYSESGGPGLGLYLVTLDLPDPGTPFLVAVQGGSYGEAALNVVAPEHSKVAVPGARANAVATPTLADAMGMQRLCTADPVCGMHEVSLDAAVAAGRPVALIFATPAYCQTAVCAPAVATVEGVRTGRAWGDVAWVHVEIYRDAGQTLSAPVEAWRLPTEPWLFTIGRDGTIADRLDGPMLPEVVTEMVTAVA
jgi:hypothetical protein